MRQQRFLMAFLPTQMLMTRCIVPLSPNSMLVQIVLGQDLVPTNEWVQYMIGCHELMPNQPSLIKFFIANPIISVTEHCATKLKKLSLELPPKHRNLQVQLI